MLQLPALFQTLRKGAVSNKYVLFTCPSLVVFVLIRQSKQSSIYEGYGLSRIVRV